jgi:FtsP/CotA-like multicopper oxidase with cupredoxin domain
MRARCEIDRANAAPLNRRQVLGLAAAAGVAGGLDRGAIRPVAAQTAIADRNAAADYTLRIATGLLELGPDTTVSTKLYNNQFPGPLLRFTEGKRVVIDVHNDTDTPELVHFHGEFLPAAVDGAAEEGSPYIPAHGTRRLAFTPRPAGFRFYHTHVPAGLDLSLGLYSGQAGLVYIEPRREPGAYDREVFLTLKEFGPYFSRTEMPSDFLAPDTVDPELKEANEKAEKESADTGNPQGYEPAYNFLSINGRMLGQGEPIRVKTGERVLFHVVNASASDNHGLALPGHVFRVVALDGNPVPNPAEVPVLWLGTAERISAIVEMNRPGVWVLGETDNDARGRGMGIVVEYADAKGDPQWEKAPDFRWDYRLFTKPDTTAAAPDETITMTISSRDGARQGFDEFAINGVPFSMAKMEPMFQLSRGRRYRLHLRNATDDVHPVHLHRHSFEITSIAGAPTAGVIKDVAMLAAFQEMTVDFTADQPGLSLFHCHMQQHMDFGFMALLKCT